MSVSVSGNSCRPCTGTTASPGCQIRLAGKCVYYAGSPIASPQINTGENYDSILAKLVDTIGDLREEIGTEANFPEIFSLPSNFQTQSVLPYALFNASTSPAPTAVAVGPYDKITLGPSPMNPNTIAGVTFFNLPAFNGSNCRDVTFRVKVDALGATNPMIGIGMNNNNQTGDIDGKPRGCMVDFRNALLGGSNGIAAIVRNPTSVPPFVNQEANIFHWEAITQARGGIGVANTYVTAGNIVRLRWEIDSRNLTERFTFFNEATGAYLEATSNLGFGPQRTVRSTFGYAQAYSFMLSDGTYTILEYKSTHLAKRGVKVFIAGDSMGRGDRIYAEESLPYKIDKLYPNNSSCSADAGAEIYSIQKQQIPDIIRLQPKYTFLFHYIPILDGRFLTTNSDYPNYIDAFTKVMNGILGANSIPVLIKPPFWPWPGVTQLRMDQWYTFIDQQLPLFPGTLLLDLRPFALTYDNTTFPHYTGYSNQIISEQMQKLILQNEA